MQSPETRNHRGVTAENLMTPTSNPNLGHIHSLLAERGYEITEPTEASLRIRDVESGVAVQAVIEGDIVYFSLVCVVVPRARITADIMWKMLAADNGISTSAFQIYDAGEGKAA